jgi:hypothetical protein
MRVSTARLAAGPVGATARVTTFASFMTPKIVLAAIIEADVGAAWAITSLQRVRSARARTCSRQKLARISAAGTRFR